MCSECFIRQARIEDLEEKFHYMMVVNRELAALLGKTSDDLFHFLENLSEQGLEEPATSSCGTCKDSPN